MLETLSVVWVAMTVTILLGLLCMFLGDKSNGNIQKIGGWKLYCFFGLIGIPIHELSHLIMCLIFLHKPTKIELFRPIAGKTDGKLGFVEHSYKTTKYRKAGNFLIGVAPMIFGSILIGLIFLIFMPDFFDKLSNISSIKEMFVFSLQEFLIFFNFKNIKKWQFWIALYFIISISINMNMSKQDLKNSLLGIISFMIFCIIATLSIYLIPGLYFLGKYINKLIYMYILILLFGSMISLFVTFFTYFLAKIKK